MRRRRRPSITGDYIAWPAEAGPVRRDRL
jgi:hypothetical protein